MMPPAHLQTLMPLWSLLPAFRAVAETQHLPSAARLLGIGPSSLSRSISLLERALKKPMFRRSGRSLRLNADGQALLATVRDAMRRVDDGLAELAGAGLRGVLTVASSGAGTTALVAPALQTLRQQHPFLLPQLVTRAPHETPAELLHGRIDVAFQELPVQREGLVATVVGSIARGIYCGRRHPLFDRSPVRESDLENAEFVAQPPSAEGVMMDGWPAERPRHIALTTDQLRVGLELCASMPLLAVLPDVLATAHTELRRLPFDFVPPSTLYAIHRRVLNQRLSAAVQLVVLVKG